MKWKVLTQKKDVTVLEARELTSEAFEKDLKVAKHY